MDIFYKHSIVSLFVILLSSATLFSQDEKFEKTIEKTFSISESGHFYLNSTYGDIIVNGWDKNTVVIEATISVTHKKSSTAKELIDRIETDFKTTTDFVRVTSKISDAKKTLISRLFNDVNPIELDKPNVQIDYKVYVPKKIAITLENKFGDIIISDYYGDLTATLSHGNLWVNQDLSKVNFKLSYVKLKASSLQEAFIQSDNCELTMVSVDDLKLRSKGTDINIEDITDLDIISKNDEITIFQIGTISGELKYTTLTIDELKKDLDLRLHLADMNVSKIIAEAPTLKIYQKSSTLLLNVSATNLLLNAVLEQGTFHIPTTFSEIDTSITDEKKNRRTIKASYGASSTKGELTINGIKGQIIIKD